MFYYEFVTVCKSVYRSGQVCIFYTKKTLQMERLFILLSTMFKPDV